MTQTGRTMRIGVGAGMADDRIAPGVELLRTVELDYLVCECLAERAIALETLSRKRDPSKGYTPMLEERMQAFLPLCRERVVRLVTNMGAVNPVGAAGAILHAAAKMGWRMRNRWCRPRTEHFCGWRRRHVCSRWRWRAPTFVAG